MAWTHAIMQLQQTDMELQSNQQRLVEIANMLKDNAELEQSQKHLEQMQKVAKQTRINQETQEFELSKVQNKLRVDTEKLYSGRITNTRELQALQAETESLKRHITSMEDKLLEAMLEREEANEEVASAKQAFEQLTKQTETNHQHLFNEQTELTTRNTELETEMSRLQEQIPPAILDTYQYLKPRTANTPVAQLKGEICGVCGIEVIKPTQQKARRNEEAYCGGCHRLLVIID